MRSFLAVFVALLHLSVADICGGNSVINTDSLSGTFSCAHGYAGTTDWYVPAGAACTVKVVDSFWTYDANYEFLEIFDNNVRVGLLNHNTANKGMVYNISTFFHMRFTERYSDNNGNSRFTIEYSCGRSTVLSLVSGQDFKVRNTTSRGGFVYFALPGALQTMGASLEFNFLIGTYRGLKQPSFFLSRNALPTLEKYDWTNATAPNADKSDWTWKYRMANPATGSYYVGMYLYGTYSRIVANARWTYNIPNVKMDEPITYTLKANSPFYTIIPVPVGAASFSVEVAREVPGGNTTFYLKQGLIPSAKDFDRTFEINSVDSYKLDTTRNPNPASPDPKQQNPGVWILSASSKTTAGFLMKVTVP